MFLQGRWHSWDACSPQVPRGPGQHGTASGVTGRAVLLPGKKCKSHMCMSAWGAAPGLDNKAVIAPGYTQGARKRLAKNTQSTWENRIGGELGLEVCKWQLRVAHFVRPPGSVWVNDRAVTAVRHYR
ncbi:Ferm And Pdz Domain-Containing Protein 1 [Manis pentadactyla]|nr:Ferm And Pdz Domain-Containing Protein 1 [Manis pentadactyla]